MTGEALTRAHAGQPLSSEIITSAPRPCPDRGKATVAFGIPRRPAPPGDCPDFCLGKNGTVPLGRPDGFSDSATTSSRRAGRLDVRGHRHVRGQRRRVRDGLLIFPDGESARGRSASIAELPSASGRMGRLHSSWKLPTHSRQRSATDHRLSPTPNRSRRRAASRAVPRNPAYPADRMARSASGRSPRRSVPRPV